MKKDQELYRELMDEIHVTPDMRARILDNIAQADLTPEPAPAEETNRKVVRLPSRPVLQRILPIVAALVFVFTGAFAFANFQNPDSGDMQVVGSANMTEDSPTGKTTKKDEDKTKKSTKADDVVTGSRTVASKKQLEQELGFEVAEVKTNAIPFSVSSTSYKSTGNKVAEIQYNGKNNSVQLRSTPTDNDPASAKSRVLAGANTSVTAEKTTKTTKAAKTTKTTKAETTTVKSTKAEEPTAGGSEEEGAADNKPTESTTAEPTTEPTTQPTTTTTTKAAEPDGGRTSRVASVNGRSVTLYGENGAYDTAVWTDGDYYYSIQLETPVSYDEMVTLIRAVQ